MNRHILAPHIEVETLALLTVQLMDHGSPFTTVAFKYALPQAYECLKLTRDFLEERNTEEEAKEEAYWASEEGRKKLEERKARFEELRKRHK